MYPEPKSVDSVDTGFSCDGTPHIACHQCKVLHCALHVSILCQSEICVGLRQFWTVNLAVVVVASGLLDAAVDTRPSVPTVDAASAYHLCKDQSHTDIEPFMKQLHERKNCCITCVYMPDVAWNGHLCKEGLVIMSLFSFTSFT